MKLTRKDRLDELSREIMWLEEKGIAHLERALDRMATLSEQHAREVSAFKLFYFAREGERPLSLREIAPRMSRTSSAVGLWKRKVMRRLKHPNWKDEARWPAVVTPPALSPMSADRAREIAVSLQVRRYQSIGTERYVAELKEAARDLRISEDEMGRFFLAICDRIAKRW